MINLKNGKFSMNKTKQNKTKQNKYLLTNHYYSQYFEFLLHKHFLTAILFSKFASYFYCKKLNYIYGV